MIATCTGATVLTLFSVVVLGLLAYAIIECIRILVRIRRVVDRLDRATDVTRIFDWLRKRRS